MDSFGELEAADLLSRGTIRCLRRNFGLNRSSKLSGIQRKTLGAILRKRKNVLQGQCPLSYFDVPICVSACTGEGKTLIYALPIVEGTFKFSVVLVPSTSLKVQVESVLRSLVASGPQRFTVLTVDEVEETKSSDLYAQILERYNLCLKPECDREELQFSPLGFIVDEFDKVWHSVDALKRAFTLLNKLASGERIKTVFLSASSPPPSLMSLRCDLLSLKPPVVVACTDVTLSSQSTQKSIERFDASSQNTLFDRLSAVVSAKLAEVAAEPLPYGLAVFTGSVSPAVVAKVLLAQLRASVPLRLLPPSHAFFSSEDAPLTSQTVFFYGPACYPARLDSPGLHVCFIADRAVRGLDIKTLRCGVHLLPASKTIMTHRLGRIARASDLVPEFIYFKPAHHQIKQKNKISSKHFPPSNSLDAFLPPLIIADLITAYTRTNKK